MHAIVADSPGGPFHFSDVECPSPTKEQLLIDVAFAHVSPTSSRTNAHGIPGSAGCGRVAEDPQGEVAPGTLVAFVDAKGAYAEQVVVDRTHVAAVPEGIDEPVAACMLEPGMTAHALLHGVRDTADGDTMVITDGASPVGLALTQLAAVAGATVFSVVNTSRGEELAYNAGATGVFRYFADAAQRICEANGGNGVHVVYEGNSGALPDAIHPFQLALEACAPRGLICAYGANSGERAGTRVALEELDAHGGLFLTRPSLRWYTRTSDEFRLRSQAVTRAVEEGTLRFPVSNVFPLKDAAAAHALASEPTISGGVVLAIEG